MIKSIATLALAAFVALGLLYIGAMTLAHGYVHRHEVYHKSTGHNSTVYHKSTGHNSTHTKHGTMVHTGSMAY